MKFKLLKNYVWNMSYQVLLIFMPLITTPYISRVLGSDGVGIYNYTESVVSAFTLFAVLGTNSYAIREIAYHQTDKNSYSQLFYEICFIRTITTIVLLPIYYFVIVKNGKYFIIYMIAILSLISVPFDISWLFQGLEEFSKIAIRNFIFRIFSVFLIFAFVKNKNDVVIYLLIMFGTNLAGNISLWFYLPKYIEKYQTSKFYPIRHIKATLIFFIPAISSYIYTSLDKIVLGLSSTESEVGYYSQSEKIVKLLMTLIYALSTVLMPRMANIIKNGDMEKVKFNVGYSYQFVLFLSLPMILGLVAISDFFVPLFLGNGYEKCIPLICILAPLIFIMGISSMTGTTVMIAMRMQKRYNMIIIGASLINLFLNIILVKRFNSFGVAASTIFAELFVMISEVNSIKKLVDFKKFLRNFFRYGTNAIVMSIFILVVKSFLVCSWKSVIILVLIGVFIYFTILFLQHDEFFIFIMNMIKKEHNHKL